MTLKFSAKEIHFLKSDSDDVDFHPPEKFYSDLLQDKTAQVKHFIQRLSDYDIPGEKFLCAVFKISTDQTEDFLEKANTTFEKTFNAFLDNERGMWEALGDCAIVLAFWDFKNLKKAVALLVRIKEKLSETLDTDILVGVSHFPFNDFKKEQTFDNALKALDHAAFFGPGSLQQFDSVSLNISADRLYQTGHLDQAVMDYKTGLALDKRDTNLMNSLGVCYGIANDLEKAKEQFKKANKIKPDDIMIMYNIGLIHMIEEDFDSAVIYLKKAHAQKNDVFEVELLLGQLLVKTERPNQAFGHLETAAKQNPSSGLAFRLLGEILLSRDEYEDAAKRFNTAIKCNPSDAVSLSGYARCLEARDKNLTIALSFAQNSVALDPSNPLYKQRLTDIQNKLDAQPPQAKTIKSA